MSKFYKPYDYIVKAGETSVAGVVSSPVTRREPPRTSEFVFSPPGDLATMDVDVSAVLDSWTRELGSISTEQYSWFSHLFARPAVEFEPLLMAEVKTAPTLPGTVGVFEGVAIAIKGSAEAAYFAQLAGDLPPDERRLSARTIRVLAARCARYDDDQIRVRDEAILNDQI